MTSNLPSLYTKAERVYKKVVKLNQNKKKELTEYLEQEFEIPKTESIDQRATTSAKSCKEKQLAKKLDDEKGKSATLKRKVLDLEHRY